MAARKKTPVKRRARRDRTGIRVSNQGTFQNVFHVELGQRLVAVGDNGLKVVIEDDRTTVVGQTAPAFDALPYEGLHDSAAALDAYYMERVQNGTGFMDTDPGLHLLLMSLSQALQETRL